MRSGPYKPGRAAEAFLSQRLAGGAVPVGQLVAEAEQEGIVPATLSRAARRLKVTKPVCWALPEQSAPVEAERRAVIPESDLQVGQAVVEMNRLIKGGMGRDFAIHQACQGDRELEARVRKELAR